MRLVLTSDWHLSDRPPSSCTETYQDDLFDLLEQARQVTRRHGDALVGAGDIFDKKAPSRTSHRLVHRACAFVKECIRDFPVYITPGNHDIQNDRIESVMQTQPLGMLYRAGATELNGWAPDGSPLYGVPWQQGYGPHWDYDGDDPLSPIEVRVGEALRAYREQVFDFLGPGIQKPLVVAHAPLYPPGRELPYEFFPAERWAESMGGAGCCFYGHVHEPHGVYREGGVTYCNNGALSRGSLHEYNLDRQVGVTIYDTETGTFAFHPLDAKPAPEVFRLTEKQQATDMQGRLDDFLSSAGAAKLEVCNIESVLAHVRSLGLGKPLEDLVEELLNG